MKAKDESKSKKLTKVTETHLTVRDRSKSGSEVSAFLSVMTYAITYYVGLLSTQGKGPSFAPDTSAVEGVQFLFS